MDGILSLLEYSTVVTVRSGAQSNRSSEHGYSNGTRLGLAGYTQGDAGQVHRICHAHMIKKSVFSQFLPARSAS